MTGLGRKDLNNPFCRGGRQLRVRREDNKGAHCPRLRSLPHWTPGGWWPRQAGSDRSFSLEPGQRQRSGLQGLVCRARGKAEAGTQPGEARAGGKVTVDPARSPGPCSGPKAGTPWATVGHPSQTLCFMDPDVAGPGSGLPGRTQAGVRYLERSPRTQAAGRSNSSVFFSIERKSPKGQEFKSNTSNLRKRKMTCQGDARDP